jgi:hypothetical protein
MILMLEGILSSELPATQPGLILDYAENKPFEATTAFIINQIACPAKCFHQCSNNVANHAPTKKPRQPRGPAAFKTIGEMRSQVFA